MQEQNLLLICGTAIVVVFLLLGLLATIMNIITKSFPFVEIKKSKSNKQSVNEIDGIVVAAITSAAGKIYPGSKISYIEELK